jgi:hypothetical protein
MNGSGSDITSVVRTAAAADVTGVTTLPVMSLLFGQPARRRIMKGKINIVMPQGRRR